MRTISFYLTHPALECRKSHLVAGGGDGEPCEVDVKGLSVSEAAAAKVVWMDSSGVGQRNGSVQTRSSRLVFLLMNVLFLPVRPTVSWVGCFIHLHSLGGNLLLGLQKDAA